jgi:hypothetical protein
VFDRIHCPYQIHCSFGRFIDKINRYLSVGDFTVHISNQINFDRFLPNLTDFFLKPDGIEEIFFLKTNGIEEFFKHCPTSHPPGAALANFLNTAPPAIHQALRSRLALITPPLARDRPNPPLEHAIPLFPISPLACCRADTAARNKQLRCPGPDRTTKGRRGFRGAPAIAIGAALWPVRACNRRGVEWDWTVPERGEGEAEEGGDGAAVPDAPGGQRLQL